MAALIMADDFVLLDLALGICAAPLALATGAATCATGWTTWTASSAAPWSTPRPDRLVGPAPAPDRRPQLQLRWVVLARGLVALQRGPVLIGCPSW